MALRLSVLLLVLALGAGPVGAQSLEVRGGAGGAGAAMLRRIVERDSFRIIDRDTVLPASTRIEADLVVVEADVRLEGVVEGSVAVLGGELFLRPGSRVGGGVVVAGGEVYPSGLATVGEIHRLPLNVGVEVGEGNGGYTVDLVPPPPPSPLAPDGIAGVGFPTYDRVNGVTVRVGGRLRLGSDPDGAHLRGTALYHSARGEVGGIGAFEVPLGRGLWAVAEAARTPVTNEQWIRGDLPNSLAALFARSDARNYHQSDELSFSLLRRPSQPTIQGETFVGPRLTLRASRDRSLSSSGPWSLFGDEWRPNPPIAEGTLVSLTGGAAGAWRGATSRFDGDVAVEWAPSGWGDFAFTQLVAAGRWEMMGLWGHSIQVYGRTLLPLGESGAPPQRWSFVGGTNTLPTLEFGALRGDHLVFVKSIYSAPVSRVQLPVLGVPSLQVVHAAGSAWRTGEPSPRWEQNLGAGFAFSLLEAVVYVDPAERPLEPRLNLGLSLPF